MVSWKLAAEMKLSVESDALVMPSRSGRPTQGRPPFSDDTIVFLAEAELVDLLLEQEAGVADLFDLDPAKHLANDGFDVLVGDGDALETVDFLDFVDQVALQLLLTEHGEDVMRVQRTIHERLAGAHALAFLHVDVDAARHGVFLLFSVVGGDVDLALTLGDFAELDRAIDLADDRGFARLAGLEELDDAGQTAGDVLGARGFARDLGKDIAGRDLVAILDHEVRAGRHEVTLVALGTLDDDGRLALLVRRIGDDETGEASDFIDFFVEGDAFLQVLELDGSADLGEDREGVRVPLGHGLAELDGAPSSTLSLAP